MMKKSILVLVGLLGCLAPVVCLLEDEAEAKVILARPPTHSGPQPISDEANLTARWTAESGVEEAAADAAEAGDPVLNWISTHGSFTLTQATLGDRPLYQENVQGQRPGVQFVSSDWLALGSALMTFSTTQEWTVYIAATMGAAENNVILAPSDTTVSEIFGSFGYNSSLFPRVGLRNGSSNNLQYAVATKASDLDAFFVGTYQVLDGAASNLNYKVWLNDEGYGELINDATIPASTNEFVIGGVMLTTGISATHEGYVFEVRIYDVEHGAAMGSQIYNEMYDWWN